jgi:hypothetical protein
LSSVARSGCKVRGYCRMLKSFLSPFTKRFTRSDIPNVIATPVVSPVLSNSTKKARRTLDSNVVFNQYQELKRSRSFETPESSKRSSDRLQLSNRLVLLLVAVVSALVGTFTTLGVVGLALQFERPQFPATTPGYNGFASPGEYLTFVGSEPGKPVSIFDLNTKVVYSPPPKAAAARRRIRSTVHKICSGTRRWISDLFDDVKRSPAEYMLDSE